METDRCPKLDSDTRSHSTRASHNERRGGSIRDFRTRGPSEMVDGLIASIDARFLSKYESIARWWARCGRSISLSYWVNSKSVLLLGYDANSDAVNLINQAIFLRVSQLVNSLPEDPFGKRDQTWFLLDELRFIGKLAGLPELMSFGRSENARVLLSLQDVDGFYDVYGEHKANEMLSLCGNVGILKLMSPKTRELAAKLFGNYEAWEDEVTWGVTDGPGGRSVSESTSRRKVNRESILPSEFLDLPPVDRLMAYTVFFIPRLWVRGERKYHLRLSTNIWPLQTGSPPVHPKARFCRRSGSLEQGG